MKIWAEIKKAINSDLSKPLDTLIKDYLGNSTYGLNALKTLINNKSTYPNVSVKTNVTTSYTTITGKGKITLISGGNSTNVQTLYVVIDGVSHSFGVGGSFRTYVDSVYHAVYPNVISFSFEQSFKVKIGDSDSSSVSYIAQLSN